MFFNVAYYENVPCLIIAHCFHPGVNFWTQLLWNIYCCLGVWLSGHAPSSLIGRLLLCVRACVRTHLARVHVKASERGGRRVTGRGDPRVYKRRSLSVRHSEPRTRIPRFGPTPPGAQNQDPPVGNRAPHQSFTYRVFGELSLTGSSL